MGITSDEGQEGRTVESQAIGQDQLTGYQLLLEGFLAERIEQELKSKTSGRWMPPMGLAVGGLGKAGRAYFDGRLART